MSSAISTSIKNRKKANDIFITPRDLALKHIRFIDSRENDFWLDPCRNNENGSYYSQFPTDKKDWCEALENKDFFDYECKIKLNKFIVKRPIDIICCNPPYSILNKWIEKCISLNPRIISMLIGVGNLTARRIETFNKAGYGIAKLKMLKVYEWYGMSYIVVFEKDKDNIIEIDRKVYRSD